MCEVNSTLPDDPEDGLPDETQRALKALDTSPTSTWEAIYHLLFPSDSDIPSRGKPPFPRAPQPNNPIVSPPTPHLRHLLLI